MDRPTFEIDGTPIRAAGITLYARQSATTYVLLMKRQHGDSFRYEDPGGKTDNVDTSIAHVAARETCEETNGVLDKDDLLNAIKTAPVCVTPNSKYASYYVQIRYNPELPGMFGNRETLDGIERTYEWIDVKHVFGLPLNPRLGQNWVAGLLRL